MEADAEFIAHVPEDIAYLLAEVKRLQRDIGSLEFDLCELKTGHNWNWREPNDIFPCEWEECTNCGGARSQVGMARERESEAAS